MLAHLYFPIYSPIKVMTISCKPPQNHDNLLQAPTKSLQAPASLLQNHREVWHALITFSLVRYLAKKLSTCSDIFLWLRFFFDDFKSSSLELENAANTVSAFWQIDIIMRHEHCYYLNQTKMLVCFLFDNGNFWDRFQVENLFCL